MDNTLNNDQIFFYPNIINADFTVVNKILDDRTYIAGKNFSIADITAFCTISFADRLKFEIPEEATNLRRWLENINSRPSTLV